MYTFKVYHNGRAIDGTPVFPLRWQDLLDERLDECYIDLIGSSTEFFTPTDDVRIEIYENGVKADTKYYIIARDDARRFPNWGKSTYSHTLHLLERTKLLEGIICPSLTFTNAISKYTLDSAKSVEAIDLTDDKTLANQGFSIKLSDIKSPVLLGSTVQMPSMNEIAQTIHNQCYGAGYAVKETQVEVGSHLSWVTTIQGDTKSETTNPDSGIAFEANEYTIVKYRLSLYFIPEAQDSPVPNYKVFEFQFEFVPTRQKYPRPRLTILNVIDRVLNCAVPLRDGGRMAKYELCGADRSRYENVLAPEFSMTSCTLREQLKIIGSFVHAEPWLDDQDKVRFKDYGNSSVSSLKDKSYTSHQSMHDINEYHTSLLSTAQNVTVSLESAPSVFAASSKMYLNPRANIKYARLEDANGVIRLPSPVYTIRSVMCGISGGNTGWFMNPVDITKYVHEATDYNANLKDFDDSTSQTKAYAIYYTIGGDTIEGIFHRTQEARVTKEEYAITNILSLHTDEKTKDEIQTQLSLYPQNLLFQVEYIPLTDVAVQHGKQRYEPGRHPFTKQYNQSENMVECEWLGENIKGTAARLGNRERERTYYLDTYNDIPEVGELLDGYRISSVAVEMLPYYLKCTVGLTREFERLSEYIGISSIKRLYEISERQTYLRDIVIHNTLVIGALPGNHAADKERAFIRLDGVKDALLGDSNTGVVRTASVKTYDDVGVLAELILPVYAKSLGNAVSLSFGFADNYSAGTFLDFKEGEKDVQGYWETDVPYTDYYGNVKACEIQMYAESKVNFSDSSNNAVNQAISLPRRWQHLTPFDGTSYAVNFVHKLDKDSREIPRYSLILEAKTTDSNITVGSGIALMNSMVYDYVNNKRAGHTAVYLTKDSISQFTQHINTASKDFTYVGDTTVSDSTSYLQLGVEIDENVSLPTDLGFYYVVVAQPSYTEERTVDAGNGKSTTEELLCGGEVLLIKRVQLGVGQTLYKVIKEAIKGICFYIKSDYLTK